MLNGWCGCMRLKPWGKRGRRKLWIRSCRYSSTIGIGRFARTQSAPLVRSEVSRPIDGCGDQWDEEMLTLGAAVRALGAIRDEAAIPSLMKALRYTVTRAEAADALTRFGSAVIAPLLAVLARESDDNIRYHVKDTLAKVGWRPGRI